MPIKGPWKKWVEKYYVHEETVEDFYTTVREGRKAIFEQPLRETRRAAILDGSMIAPGVIPFDGLIREQIVPAAHLKEGVPVTVYKPRNLPQEPLVVIYYHGGGLVLANRNTYDNCMKQLAMNLPAILVIIGYRLLPCPEDPLAPFNDCVAATEWILKNKTAVEGHHNSKIVAIGDSAGGQILSSVTYSIKEGIDLQIIVYPVADVKCDVESFKEFKNLPGFTTRSMETMIEMAGIGSEEMAKNPRVNPSARTDLHTCPPTLMIISPLDPLRDWGLNFANKLKAAGVEVELVTVHGAPHGFFARVGAFPTKSKEGCDIVKRYLKSKL